MPNETTIAPLYVEAKEPGLAKVGGGHQRATPFIRCNNDRKDYLRREIRHLRRLDRAQRADGYAHVGMDHPGRPNSSAFCYDLSEGVGRWSLSGWNVWS